MGLVRLGLFLFAFGAGTASAGGQVPLHCDVTSPIAIELCDALRRELGEQPLPANVTLVLSADTPRPAMLTARLDVIRDGAVHRGETGSISVTDRAALHPRQLDRFAAALIARSDIFSFNSR